MHIIIFHLFRFLVFFFVYIKLLGCCCFCFFPYVDLHLVYFIVCCSVYPSCDSKDVSQDFIGRSGFWMWLCVCSVQFIFRKKPQSGIYIFSFGTVSLGAGRLETTAARQRYYKLQEISNILNINILSINLFHLFLTEKVSFETKVSISTSAQAETRSHTPTTHTHFIII